MTEHIVEDNGWKQDAVGGEGQEVSLQLMLRVVADVGIVGYPNAGKSSLLAALTRSACTSARLFASMHWFPTCPDHTFCGLSAVVAVQVGCLAATQQPACCIGVHTLPCYCLCNVKDVPVCLQLLRMAQVNKASTVWHKASSFHAVHGKVFLPLLAGYHYSHQKISHLEGLSAWQAAMQGVT